MDKQAEMSLDEVLSSIKQMVISDEPPVLELTDMVNEDGNIVKIKKTDSISNESVNTSKDMDMFLKLAQEEEKAIDKTSIDKISTAEEKNVNKNSNILKNIIIEIAEPIIKNWLQENLPIITREIVKDKVKDILEK